MAVEAPLLIPNGLHAEIPADFSTNGTANFSPNGCFGEKLLGA